MTEKVLGARNSNALRWGSGLAFILWACFVLVKFVETIHSQAAPWTREWIYLKWPYWLGAVALVAATLIVLSLAVILITRLSPQRHNGIVTGLVIAISATVMLVVWLGLWRTEVPAPLIRASPPDAMILLAIMGLLTLGIPIFLMVWKVVRTDDPLWSGQVIVGTVAFLFAVITFLARAWSEVLTLFWMITVAWIIGRYLLVRLMGLQGLTHLEEFLFAVGLGFGVLSLGMFFLGTLGLWHPWLIYLLFGLLTVAGRHQLLYGAKALSQAWAQAGESVRCRAVPSILGSVMVLIAMVNFVAALAPELQSDALGLHLALPVIYARTHRLSPVPWLAPSYWPMLNGEMLYTLATLLLSPGVAKLLHYAFGLLDVALLFCLGRRLGGTRVGFWASFIFYSFGIVWVESGTAYIDLALVFYTVLMIFALLLWTELSQRWWLVIAGVLGGVGTGVKLLAGFAFVPATLIVVIDHLTKRPRRLRTLIVDGACLAAVGFTGIATWFVYTKVNGGPFSLFPSLARLFRLAIQVEKVPIMAESGYFGVGYDPWTMVKLPWTLTFYPEKFGEVGSYGMTLLVLGISLILRPRIRGREGYLLLSCVVLSYLWAVTGQNIRYGMATAALWAVAVSNGFVRLMDWLGRGKVRIFGEWLFVAVGLGSVIFGLNSWYYSGTSGAGFPYKVVFGWEPVDTYLSTRYRIYDSILFLNRTYGATANVLAPLCRDGFYAQFPLHSEVTDASATLPSIEAVYEATSPYELRRSLIRGGFTHFVVNDSKVLPEYPDFAQRQNSWMDHSLLDRALVLEYASRGVYVYRVPRTDLASTLPLTNSDNLLQDPGFETSWETSPWVSVGSPSTDQSGTNSRTGQGAVLVDKDNRLFQQLPTHAGRLYQLSFYARQADDDARGRLGISWRDGNEKPIRYGYIPYYAERGYQLYELAEVAPPGARYAVVYLIGLKGRIWVDDVSFVELGVGPGRKSFPSRLAEGFEELPAIKKGWDLNLKESTVALNSDLAFVAEGLHSLKRVVTTNAQDGVHYAGTGVPIQAPRFSFDMWLARPMIVRRIFVYMYDEDGNFCAKWVRDLSKRPIGPEKNSFIFEYGISQDGFDFVGGSGDIPSSLHVIVEIAGQEETLEFYIDNLRVDIE